MPKRKSLPTKISLSSSDEEAVKKSLNEFKQNESDMEEDNGVFEEEDNATELNSDIEDNLDTDTQQSINRNLNNNQLDKKDQLNSDKSSAMLNNLMSNAVQAMKKTHKKFRSNETDDNLDNFTNNLNNSNNLNSLMNLAMGNQSGLSPVDIFTLSQMDNNEQILSTIARLANANALNNDQQISIKKEHQQTKNNNGLIRRRKRSEEDEDNETKEDEDDCKTNNLTTNLLAAITNNQQQQPINNLNEQIPLTQIIEAQLSNVRKTLPDNESKQETERKIFDIVKQISELKEKLMLNQQTTEVQQNGNSLANGSTFNNLPLDIVS